MQPVWLRVVAVPVQPVRPSVPVAVLVEVPPEGVRLVPVHSVPLAIKSAEDSRASPISTPTPTSIPTQPDVQEQHKPERLKPNKGKGEEYASAVLIRGVKS